MPVAETINTKYFVFTHVLEKAMLYEAPPFRGNTTFLRSPAYKFLSQLLKYVAYTPSVSSSVTVHMVTEEHADGVEMSGVGICGAICAVVFLIFAHCKRNCEFGIVKNCAKVLNVV